MVTNVGKDGTFPAHSCFLTMDSFWFEEIVTGNGAFQEILIPHLMNRDLLGAGELCTTYLS